MFGKVDEHPPDWLDRLRTAPEMTVAVVGGSGRLGSWLTYFLASAGHRVRVVDTVAPLPAERVSFHRCDLLDGKALRNALAGCTQVCHLAALHGAHLVAGTSRSEIWNTNVLGTQHILEAATETNQVVLASSMSVYGSGTPAGMPARVLTDDTEPSPEDVYDLSKLAAERLMLRYGPRRSIALRFGRFFYPSQVDYQMRKLSTGVDVRDACQAIALALLAPAPPRPIYCVASDLPLPDPDRAQLGLDAVAVLRRHLPGLVEELDSRQLPIPARVGKSASTAGIRRDLGFRPERDLSWYHQQLRSGRATDSLATRRRARLPADEGTSPVTLSTWTRSRHDLARQDPIQPAEVRYADRSSA